MTPEQIAARQQQEAAAREQQAKQMGEQLWSYCQKFGYKRDTPEIRECAASRYTEVMEQYQATKQQEDQRTSAVIACAGRMTNAMGYIPALNLCRQNPNAVPIQQPYQPQNATCVTTGNVVNCRSY
jgi:glutamyl-tRNA reductase